MKHRGPSRGVLAIALVVGVIGGVVLSRGSEPHYGFVHGAMPLQVADLNDGTAKGTIRVYNLQKDWSQVLAEVTAESPLSVMKDIAIKGLDAKSVVVPREEGGRAKLFETPEREITVIRGRFVLSESGSVIARADDHGWSGIRVVEFRRPHLIDTATDWVRETFKV